MSNVTFGGSPSTAEAVATWTVAFTTSPTGALKRGSSITVVFNTAFGVPSAPAVSLTGGFTNCSVGASVIGTTMSLTLNGGRCALGNGATGRLAVAGIINPPAGTYAAASFSVATSADTTAASPNSDIVISTGTTATAAFTAPAPGTTSVRTATSYVVAWTERGVSSRVLLIERAAASGTTCPASGYATVATNIVSTAGTTTVSGLTAGNCYRFELLLNGGSTPAATSGTIAIVSATAADPARLATTYSLTTWAELGHSAYVNSTETVVITNNGTGYMTTVNFSALARALGYITIGSVTVNGAAATTAWTTTTNLQVTVPPTSPGSTITVAIPFNLTIPAGTGSSSFSLRMNYYNGILILGNWFPVVSRVHDAYGIGDPQVTWNASTITFNLTTSVSFGRNAVAATGDLVSAPASSGTAWQFVAHNVRDYAVAIGPTFSLYSTPVGSTTLKAYAKSGAGGATMLSTMTAAFQKYVTQYGTYPYATLTMAQAGSSGWAMEFPTMNFIGSNYLTNSYVIWHEVAHQWFYGQLGDDQLTEPWLDEAWAELSARYFLGLSLSNCSTVPINEAVSYWPGTLTDGDWSGCNGYFETVFHRGTTFLNTIRADMGTSTFFSAIRNYIGLHRYGLTTGADELRYLDAQTSYDLWNGPVYTYTSYR
ncbi:MAG TPA: hypothetical protein VIM30_08925 [Candidatus Limnocylindrales bacterium]